MATAVSARHVRDFVSISRSCQNRRAYWDPAAAMCVNLRKVAAASTCERIVGGDSSRRDSAKVDAQYPPRRILGYYFREVPTGLIFASDQKGS
jgi:hypothetical protein